MHRRSNAASVRSAASSIRSTRSSTLSGRNPKAGNKNVLRRGKRPWSRKDSRDEQVQCHELDKKREREERERAAASAGEREAERRNGTVELDELYWFVKFKPHTETRENVYIITMVSRIPRQIVSHVVSRDKSCQTIQRVADHAPDAEKYCTDGYTAYREIVYPGRHIFNIHDKRDTFTVEGVNADLRHYIPTLARRRRCFPRKLENLQAVVSVFVGAYNKFGLAKARYRSRHACTSTPFSLFDFL